MLDQLTYRYDFSYYKLWQEPNIEGLQAFHNESDSWIKVPAREDALVLNVGDMMQVISNNRVKAPLHRVVVEQKSSAEDNASSTLKSSRISAPFFYNPGYSSICEPLHTSEDMCALYKPISWAKFRAKRVQGDYADHGTEIQIEQFRIQAD